MRSVSERVEKCQRNAFIRANADDIGEVELSRALRSRARLCFPKERKEKENNVWVQAIGEMASYDQVLWSKPLAINIKFI